MSTDLARAFAELIASAPRSRARRPIWRKQVADYGDQILVMCHRMGIQRQHIHAALVAGGCEISYRSFCDWVASNKHLAPTADSLDDRSDAPVEPPAEAESRESVPLGDQAAPTPGRITSSEQLVALLRKNQQP